MRKKHFSRRNFGPAVVSYPVVFIANERQDLLHRNSAAAREIKDDNLEVPRNTQVRATV